MRNDWTTSFLGPLGIMTLIAMLHTGVGAATVVVEMANYAFVPADSSIQVGDTVTWTNLDQDFHTSTSGNNGVPNGLWDSGLFGPGGTFSFTFNIAPGRYNYYCAPHVSIGMTGSITVLAAGNVPTILTPPQSQVAPAGSTVTFSVSASGTPPLFYQWRANGEEIAGATRDTLLLRSVQTSDAGSYDVIVSNSAGSTTSQAATLMIGTETSLPPVVKLTKPASGATFALGSSVSLSATVNASGAVVTNVLFTADGLGIGSVDQAPFALVWLPTQPRSYSLNAVAFDNSGLAGTSAPVTVRVFIPDTKRPTVAVKNSPPQFARLTAPGISLDGTASDDIGLDKVVVQVNGSPTQTAVGTTSWHAEVVLAPGNNIVRVTSVDLAGNTSLPVTRYYTYVATTPLVVQLSGAGTVTPDLNGRALEIGKVYTLTARPNAGHLFAGWTGPANTNNARLSFQMESNLVLVAHFAPNPFPALAGTYGGLFSNPNAAFPATSGAFDLQLGNVGAFSGKVIMNGASYPFHGQVGSGGNVTVPVLRPTLAPLALTLHLDSAKNTIDGTGTDGNSEFALLAERRVTKTSLQGQRSFVLRRAAADGGALVSTGLLSVSGSGNVRISGRLVDGRSYSSSATLSSEGNIPFYAAFGQGSEMMIGWMHVAAAPEASPGGNLLWVRTGTDGFSVPLEVAPAPH